MGNPCGCPECDDCILFTGQARGACPYNVYRGMFSQHWGRHAVPLQYIIIRNENFRFLRFILTICEKFFEFFEVIGKELSLNKPVVFTADYYFDLLCIGYIFDHVDGCLITDFFDVFTVGRTLRVLPITFPIFHYYNIVKNWIFH